MPIILSELTLWYIISRINMQSTLIIVIILFKADIADYFAM